MNRNRAIELDVPSYTYTSEAPVTVQKCSQWSLLQSCRLALVVLVTGLGFATCYFLLFIFPRVPLTPWGDEVLFIENAIRILGGQLPYRDYLQFTTPGTETFYAVLLHVFGARAWIPNLTMALLGAVTVLLVTLISKRLLSGVAALVPGLLLVGFVFPNSMDATHHWFSTVAILVALLVWVDRAITVRRAAIAGAWCGAAACFTQSKGALVLLAFVAFLWIETSGARRHFWTRCAALCASAAALFLAVNAYFIHAAGLARFVFCTITFPLRYYPAESYNTWRIYGNGLSANMGPARALGFWFVHAAVPFAYLLWFWQRRKNSAGNDRQMRAELLMALTGLGMFLSVAPSPSLLRLCAVSPLAVILLAVLLRESRATFRVLQIATAVSVVLAAGISINTQRHRYGFLDTPTGRIAFVNRDRFEEFHWAQDHTAAGQAFFGNSPMCFALGLHNPTPTNYPTTSDFTRPNEVTAIVHGLDETRAPMLMLLPITYLPNTNSPGADHMEPFREYLSANYQLARRFPGGEEAWLRKNAGTSARSQGSPSLR